ETKAVEVDDADKGSFKKGFDALVGMEQAKKVAMNFLNLIKHADLANKLQIRQPAGVLLYGPPGCGKTFFVDRFVEELEKQTNKKCILCSFSVGTIGSSYVHATAQKIYQQFAEAVEHAKEGKIPLVFIDEIDTLFGETDNN